MAARYKSTEGGNAADDGDGLGAMDSSHSIDIGGDDTDAQPGGAQYRTMGTRQRGRNAAIAPEALAQEDAPSTGTAADLLRGKLAKADPTNALPRRTTGMETVMMGQKMRKKAAVATTAKRQRSRTMARMNSDTNLAFQQADLRRVFRLVDVDKSGNVNAHELASGMISLGISQGGYTQAVLSTLLQDIDKSKDGAIDEKEFCTFFRGKRMADITRMLDGIEATSSPTRVTIVDYGELPSEYHVRVYVPGKMSSDELLRCLRDVPENETDSRGRLVKAYHTRRRWVQVSGYDDNVLCALASAFEVSRDAVCGMGAFQQPKVRNSVNGKNLQLVIHKVELEVGPFAKPRSNDEGAVGELKTVAQLNRGAPSTRVSQLSVMVLDKTTIATVSATNRGASGEAAHEQKEVTQVMEDLKSEDPALHKEGCPFLALALLEHIVDINMAVQDALADWQEHTEEAITQFAAKRHSLHLYHMAKMATHLLDYILPLRADIGKKLQGDALLQSENDAATLGAIAEDLDTTELKVKELLASVAGLRSLYESMAADRMNQILFILTLLTVMLAPAQFLTGLYGMNFDTEKGNMPELGSKYGYTAWWVVVVLSSGTLLYFMATKLRAFELYR